MACLALGGCLDGASTQSTGEAPAVTIDLGSIEANGSPIGQEWRFAQPWASPAVYNEAAYNLWQDAIAVCADALGFTFLPVQYVDTDLNVRLLNPLNESVVSAWGYHEPTMVKPNDLNSDDSQAFTSMLFEDPGCVDLAAAFVYETEAAKRFGSTLTSLTLKIDERILQADGSNEIAELNVLWSSCMASNGYNFSSPMEARQLYGGSPGITDEERRARLADLACDQQVGLTESRSRLQATKVQAWIDDHAQEVLEIESLLVEAQRDVDRMRELLAREGADALPLTLPTRSTVESVPPSSTIADE